MTRAPFLFESFEPGGTLGQIAEQVNADCLSDWLLLYPWDVPSGGTVPAGMATVLMMRAYLHLVTPRPPGNLHVRQRLSIRQPIRMGDTVTTAICCFGKVMKGTRRQVELVAEAVGADGERLFDGTITLFWAA